MTCVLVLTLCSRFPHMLMVFRHGNCPVRCAIAPMYPILYKGQSLLSSEAKA